MRTARRLFPILVLILFTCMVSLSLYEVVMNHETEQGWDELQTTTQSVKEEISTKFTDEITKLQLMRKIMQENRIYTAENIESLYLEIVQPTTIFTRIDILYPDNTVISNGKVVTEHAELDFQKIVQQGEGMSHRRTDFFTGDQYIYYVLPVEEGDSVRAVLIAALDTGRLTSIFEPIIYNGVANICIVDATDGNYIMDSWHEKLGNVFQEEGRETLPGYEGVDAGEALTNRETGSAVFRSKTTGKNIYLYFTPLEQFDWQLFIFAQEDVLFADVYPLKRIFWLASVMEVILFGIYFFFHFRNVKQLEKSYLYIQQQKEELVRIGYTDLLTQLYNRNKFMFDLNAIQEDPPGKLGIAYMDLNGLNVLNDSQSHEAGDRYLQRTAKVLYEVFHNEAYRIGGDEFMVVAKEITESAFIEKIQILQEKFEEADVSCAIGMEWISKVTDAEELMKRAERQMYRRKAAFYQGKREKDERILSGIEQ